MRRWLCAWLALLTALQVVASLLAGLQGSLHRHRPGLQTSAPSTLALRWDHARAEAMAAHQALHQRGELHTHDFADASVVPIAAEVANDALAQLGSAFAPAGHDGAQLHATAGYAPPHAAAWSATSRPIAPLLKPPRG
jgi:hypothetical protein